MSKIAVCGSGSVHDDLVAEKAKQLGVEIARSRNVLLTGGCSGYPYAALRGAILENGKSICYSPAKDKEEHIGDYSFPFEESSEYIFTGKGIPERNFDLIKAADAVIILDGKIGTLNEFTIAFALGKKIGILENVNGISTLIPKIAEICDKKGESDNIVYSDNEKELIKRLNV